MQAEQQSERERFEAELAKMPEWAPEFEPHRAWVEQYAWGLWQARAALSHPSTGQWMPIESAPKDGERLILAAEGRSFYGVWIDIQFQEYRDSDGFYVGQQDPEAYWMDVESGSEVEPTHWQPLAALPPPPQGDKQDGHQIAKELHARYFGEDV